jgi:hypothetical protein
MRFLIAAISAATFLVSVNIAKADKACRLRGRHRGLPQRGGASQPGG